MSRTGRPLALLGAIALLASAFLPWVGNGRTAIDLGLLTYGTRLAQPTIALVLIVLAAVPAVAALLDDHAWPRALSGLGAGALVVVWLARGPDGAVVSGIAWAMVGTGVLLVSSAVAEPRRRAASRYPDGALPRVPSPGDAGPDGRTITSPQDASPAPTDAGPSGQAGSRVVPFTPTPVIEAWGPTRSSCFEAAVLGSTGLVLDTRHLQAAGQVAVRLEGADDAQLLLALLDRSVDLLRSGRAPLAASLFDTDDDHIVGYVDVAETAALNGSHVPEPTTVDVEADHAWRARITFG